ncbi:MAG: Nramp family divalent metal transporter [Cyclobacteriaceae bacterium]|nr:Nramp family divalent metal transporter [Cyclobacteriaceae bacterium]
MNNKWNNFLKTLGPGILFASTCIGVSHLVQSTRAGADYGFALVWVVILANLFKYPFFEFASRYTSATGVSILDGYYKKGRWILMVFAIVTMITMFIVTAAVTFVTAGLLSNLLNIKGFDTDTWVLVVLIISTLVLTIGKYNLLDSLLKVIGTVLVISTLVAFVSALINGPIEKVPDFAAKEPFSNSGLIFIIALMGWMPTAVDMSTWTSLWTEARIKQTGYYPKLKETLLDFNIGYLVSGVLAVFFLSLGAMVIFGSGTDLSNNSTTFAQQLISMYTNSIGQWSYLIISVAAFSTMFSTSIAVMDGYSRSMARATKLLLGRKSEESKREFVVWTIILTLGTYLVATQFVNALKSLVDLATIISFVIAPLAGFLNYKVIFSKEVGIDFIPPKWLKRLAVAGLIFLSIFTVVYLVQLVI